MTHRSIAWTTTALLIVFAGNVFAAEPAPRRMTWKVSGLEREALVYLPTNQSEGGAPVVFGFHGHGGNARNVARSFGFQRLWPEALVVYMQGIPTPGRLTDPDGKRNGWQHAAGDHGDRDLKFFDAVFKALQSEYKIDADRVYATGHSNGGAFTFLLWSERHDVFAAVAPSGAASRSVRTLKPKPAMHIAGEQDPLVRFAWQQRAIEAVKTINGCAAEGKAWDKHCTLYESTKGAPLVTLIHPGGHKYPAEAPGLIARFLREHRRGSAAGEVEKDE